MSAICDDLRAAILQAAMKGKLTKRLQSDDDPERNISKHAGVDLLTNDDYPREWRLVALGDIAEMGMGKTIIKADMKESGIPVYSATISDKHLGYVENAALPLKKNDIVIPARGNSIGWATLVKEDLATCTQTTIYCRNIADFIMPRFLWMCCYAFKGEWFRYEGSAIPQITVSAIKKCLVPIPSLAEQERVIEKVDELMSRVADLEQSADALASLKKAFPSDIKAALLQAAMQGKLTRQLPEDEDVEELLKRIESEKEKLVAEGKAKKQKTLAPVADREIPFNIPENWKWVKFGDVNELISGVDLTPDKYNSKHDGIVYITGASNIEKGQIIQNRWTPSPTRIAKKGDLLLTCKGTVGTTAILDIDEAHIARQIMAIRPFCLNVSFVKLFIDYAVPVLKSNAKSMIPGIERKNVLEMPFPLPPLAEQKRIVERLGTLMQNIDVVGELIASE